MRISSILGSHINSMNNRQDICKITISYSKKTNTRVDILSRKDQEDIKEGNKDVKMLKDELWKRRQVMEVKITMFRRN